MDVIVFARRDRMCLGAVLDEPPRGGPGEGVLVLAEDGARFPMRPEGAVARAAGLDDRAEGESTVAWLERVRNSLPEPPAWDQVHRGAEPGAAYTAADLAGADERGALALALSAHEAAPWFRRKGPTLTAIRGDEARAELARIERLRRSAEADAQLTEWWSVPSEEPPPESASEAMAALKDFALSGESAATTRGRALATQLGSPEPDLFVEALVERGALPPDTNPAPYRAGLAGTLPPEALAEAENLAAARPDLDGRLDLTGLYTVAIDDPGTTEVDDAISLREGPDGTELLIHIADVASAIPPGSALDAAARRRGASLYTPDGHITMLPAPLVESRLSLTTGSPRPAITFVVPVDDGRVDEAECVRSVVQLDRRLSYEETGHLASLGGTAVAGERLVEVARALQARRAESGALVLRIGALKVTLPDGTPHVGIRKQDTAGDLVVTECMVLYNTLAALTLDLVGCPALYKTQEPPRREVPSPDDPLFAVSARRALSPTRTSTRAARHHGNGVDAYLQATSPIRRYGDLVNQRQLVARLDDATAPYGETGLAELRDHLLERERVVRSAANQREMYWLARALHARVGDTFEGVLSRKPRFGTGRVWVPSLAAELPLKASGDWPAPPVGTAATWQIARALPWRGRIELEPLA